MRSFLYKKDRLFEYSISKQPLIVKYKFCLHYVNSGGISAAAFVKQPYLKMIYAMYAA